MADTPSTSANIGELRRDVALANRIAHAVGIVTGFGHISARIPGTNTFIIPTRASPALAHPDTLLTMDVQGNVLDGAGRPNSEFWIHARIYAARADVGSVAHVHAPACIIAGQVGDTVRALHNSGALFADGVPVFERVGLIRSSELGDDVAHTLGAKRAMLLRGHGANVAESTVRRAIVATCFLEEAADLQVRALAAVGGDASKVRFYNEEEAKRVQEQLDIPAPMDRGWEYYTSLVEGSF